MTIISNCPRVAGGVSRKKRPREEEKEKEEIRMNAGDFLFGKAPRDLISLQSQSAESCSAPCPIGHSVLAWAGHMSGAP